MQHFIDCVKATQAYKVLLILDGHCSHKSLDVTDLARASGMVIICFASAHNTLNAAFGFDCVWSSEEISQPRM